MERGQSQQSDWDAPLRSSSAPVHGTLARRKAATQINVISRGGQLVEGTNDASFTQVRELLAAGGRCGPARRHSLLSACCSLIGPTGGDLMCGVR